MYKFIDLIMTFSVGSAVEKTTNKNVQFGKKRFVSLVKKTKPLQLLRKCEILREVRAQVPGSQAHLPEVLNCANPSWFQRIELKMGMSSKGCPTPNKHWMSSEGSNIVKLYPELAKKSWRAASLWCQFYRYEDGVLRFKESLRPGWPLHGIIKMKLKVNMEIPGY